MQEVDVGESHVVGYPILSLLTVSEVDNKLDLQFLYALFREKFANHRVGEAFLNVSNTAYSLYRRSQQTRLPHSIMAHHSGNLHSVHMHQSQG